MPGLLLETGACTFVPPPPLPEGPEGGQAASAPRARRGAQDRGGGAANGSEKAEAEPGVAGTGRGERGEDAAVAHGGAPASDPLEGRFSLADATAGLPGEGELWAIFETDRGEIPCRLFARRAPETVANFVGLARGLRPSYQPKEGAWTTRPFYDGTIFHRVIPGFMIQGGDPTGTGTGGAGYVIVDEIAPDLGFDRPGRLAMANRGPGTASSQFFITVGPASHLDGRHAIFGQCTEAGIRVADDIAMAPRDASDRPKEPEFLRRVRIERRPSGSRDVEGGRR